MGAISLNKVEKWFGETQVIKGVDLTIADGEFVVFVGPSGCGKSTLLRMIGGLEDTSAAASLIDGRDATAEPPSKRGPAMVFQSYALYPHMSVRENMGFPLKTAGAPKVRDREEGRTTPPSILKLGPYLDRRPKALSGGQRQRVAIGRCIVRDPTAFLFDEPLSNLDAALRVEMRYEIAKLHQNLGATMIYVTHDQVEAMTLADRIVVLEFGKIAQVGSPARAVRTAGQPVRGAVHRQPEDEHPALHHRWRQLHRARAGAAAPTGAMRTPCNLASGPNTSRSAHRGMASATGRSTWSSTSAPTVSWWWIADRWVRSRCAGGRATART
jgi:ABC-type sugar transport system ATPase subunit